MHAVDLVPHEQWNLVQDVLSTPDNPTSNWDSIVSADARACLSLCRPCGHYVKKRQLRHRGPVENIMPHQSGSLMLRALTPDEDEARGMLGGIVAKDAFVKARFEMKEAERKVLPSLLNWLREQNPWVQAYAHSVQEIGLRSPRLFRILQCLPDYIPNSEIHWWRLVPQMGNQSSPV